MITTITPKSERRLARGIARHDRREDQQERQQRDREEHVGDRA